MFIKIIRSLFLVLQKLAINNFSTLIVPEEKKKGCREEGERARAVDDDRRVAACFVRPRPSSFRNADGRTGDRDKRRWKCARARTNGIDFAADFQSQSDWSRKQATAAAPRALATWSPSHGKLALLVIFMMESESVAPPPSSEENERREELATTT